MHKIKKMESCLSKISFVKCVRNFRYFTWKCIISIRSHKMHHQYKKSLQQFEMALIESGCQKEEIAPFYSIVTKGIFKKRLSRFLLSPQLITVFFLVIYHCPWLWNWENLNLWACWFYLVNLSFSCLLCFLMLCIK